ncbi:hypothetical protein IEO70_08645 [Bacillus sp. AGMB 02131]|uniref:Uncharacterized protein n=1 Tax=Peribacillus faecalis TaxID=2772559 RepID=A0A927CVL6_9BACI|nr:hypothetical protein [Peribacillus faecalis]MBD3108433.1 hypothetical protein [Peribacillus faecalis]
MAKKRMKIVDFYSLLLLSISFGLMIFSVQLGLIFLTMSITTLSLRAYVGYKFDQKTICNN